MDELLTKMILEHIPTETQRVVCNIEITTDSDGHPSNALVHCDDGHTEMMSIYALVCLMMGGTIFHNSLRMYINRVRLD